MIIIINFSFYFIFIIEESVDNVKGILFFFLHILNETFINKKKLNFYK